MNRRLKIHILLWAISFFIFLMRQIIYNRVISDDTYQTGIFYFIIIILFFMLNLIKSRLKKCIIILCVYVIPVSIFIFYTQALYIYLTGAPANIPILPKNTWQYLIDSKVIYQYLVFFILPIFYWVGLYYLSKWLVGLYEKKIMKILPDCK